MMDERASLARTAAAPDSPLASVRGEVAAVESNMAVAETGACRPSIRENAPAVVRQSGFSGLGFDSFSTNQSGRRAEVRLAPAAVH